ncbi:acetyltransferase [Coccidioides posadasii str. Silveira]|uniref:Acetyltransferase n=1 Tax=Coccidioides posadasii (strain RMSCC 757 / Silveira) TaxID=443226 RepID=E9D555_COCPS|nr:acetyltransferase [Coccidioides posadasii str. Silveira]
MLRFEEKMKLEGTWDIEKVGTTKSRERQTHEIQSRDIISESAYVQTSDPDALQYDRERCRMALWRFNEACKPDSAICQQERNQLFLHVLMPRPNAGPLSPSPGVIVESPFKCLYGYNLQIGEDVLISENCQFLDNFPIRIGARTWIGAGVQILTSGIPFHVPTQGRVVIEQECWVGPGCIIYPGVSLHKGAYVAPGQVVKQDIRPYGFQC